MRNKNVIADFFLNLALSRKMIVLFLAAGIFPLSLLFGISLYRIKNESSRMQVYMLNKGFEQVRQSVDNTLQQMYRIATMVTVYEDVRKTLQPARGLSQIEELSEFEKISDYTYQVEISVDDVSILYYIDRRFIISESYNTCFRPLDILRDTGIEKKLIANNGKSTLCVIEEKNKYGQRQKYLADFRAVWNENHYSEMIGATATLVPLDTIRELMIGSLQNQILNLADDDGLVLASNMPAAYPQNYGSAGAGEFAVARIGRDEFMVRRAALSRDGLYLVSAAPSADFSADTRRIVREMALWFAGICVLAICLTLPISRQIVNRIHLLDRKMATADEGVIGKLEIKEHHDEIGRLIIRYNRMVERMEALLSQQFVLGKEKSDAQLAALQSQINPHFLYNTLDMMNWMAQRNETENIQNVLQSMSRFYRLVLSHGDDIVPIDIEIRMCEAYIEIQKMRKKHKIQFEMEIDAAIRNYLIPKITLQPLIENAIIHGIDEKDGGTGRVTITGRMAGERIVLAVTDDGSGMSGNALQKSGDESAGSHYGLANIERRLSLFYGETIAIEIKSTAGVGARVSIKLPLRQ